MHCKILERVINILVKLTLVVFPSNVFKSLKPKLKHKPTLTSLALKNPKNNVIRFKTIYFKGTKFVYLFLKYYYINFTTVYV